MSETLDYYSPYNIFLFHFIQLPEKTHTLCDNLRTLDISQNSLTVLPPWIGDFKVIKSLNISHNNLSMFINDLLLFTISIYSDIYQTKN